MRERPKIPPFVRKGSFGRHGILDRQRGFALFSRLARGCVDRVEYVQGEQLMILGQLHRPDVLDLARGLDADDMKRALVKLDRIVLLL